MTLQAVEESLKSVDLFNGGVGDKPVGKYSGGMKRRLSVAISLIGDPQVCEFKFILTINTLLALLSDQFYQGLLRVIFVIASAVGLNCRF